MALLDFPNVIKPSDSNSDIIGHIFRVLWDFMDVVCLVSVRSLVNRRGKYV